MNTEVINLKYQACQNLPNNSADFYESVECFVNEVLNAGECVNFNGKNVSGIYYDILINGIERCKNGDIVFHAHFDCEYGIKEFSVQQIPRGVVLKCIDRLKAMLPNIQANRDREEWWGIYKVHLKNCFKFWKDNGKNIYEALQYAVEETSKLKHNPFVPNGKEVDKKVLDDFLYKWKQALEQLKAEVNDGTYDEEEIRVCDICGLPMFEGYYLGGDYACDDECCLESYDSDKAQMEEDLSHAEEDCCETYWTEWDSVLFDY